MSTSRVFRWGILGTGWVAQRFTADLHHVQSAVPYAIASRSASRAQQVRAHFGVQQGHTSYDALIRDPEVDVVYVASAPDQHAEHALAAIRAGKHVLCEKPFAVAADDARRVVEAARAQKVFCMEAMWSRFLPATIDFLQQIEAGNIGQAHTLVADFSIPLADADSHRWLNPAQGGGALLDRGVYAISLAIRLFGKPRTVTAVGQLAATGADRTVAIQMTFADARCAMLTASLCTYAGNDATVSGSRGRLRLCEPFYRPERVTLSRAPASQGGRSSDLSPQSVGAKIRGMASRIKAYLPSDIQRSTTLCFPIQGYGYTYEAREVVRCLQEGLTESPVMPLHDTMQVMETVGQIQEELRR